MYKNWVACKQQIYFPQFHRLEVQDQGAIMFDSGEQPLQGHRLLTSRCSLTWQKEGFRRALIPSLRTPHDLITTQSKGPTHPPNNITLD